jgi:hypothetical protein
VYFIDFVLLTQNTFPFRGKFSPLPLAIHPFPFGKNKALSLFQERALELSFGAFGKSQQ